MSLAVLQLNDLNLFIQTDQGQTYSEAGYALLSDTGITTGDTARANTWLQPQNAFNQYWNNLNQTPFPTKHAHGRHHADIAYAQLKHLLQSVDNPEQLIVSVPGHFTDQQLSLLLGLLKALQVEVVGIIDSAVGASILYPKAQFVVEVQLYQTVVTALDRKQHHIEIHDQICLSDLGIMQLYNMVAGHISHQFIDQHRYDPLYSSVHERQLYDLIPVWLEALSQETEISVEIESPNGQLSSLINRQAIAQLFLQRLDSLNPYLQELSETVYFSQEASFIPNLVSKFSKCCLLDLSDSVGHCLQLAQQFPKDRLERTTVIKSSVDTSAPSSQLSSDHATAATHVLYNNTAYPIHRPISISRHGKGLIICSKMDKKADIVLAQKGQHLQVVSQQAELKVTLPSSLDLGQTLKIDGQSLALIGVDNG